MAKDLEAPKPFVPSVFSDGDKLDAGNVEEMRFGLAGSGPLAKAVLDSNNVGALRQLSAGLTPTTTIPVGTISPYAGTSAPANWLLCDGSAVSRVTYAALFAVTGTAYGAGDGSTTFNLPDLRGRAVAGKDDMGGSAASRLTVAGSGITGTTLGAAGGTQTHFLGLSEMPSHNHGGATGSSAAPVELTDGRDLVYTNAAAGVGTFGTAPGASNLQAAPHTHSISPQGSGAAHQNTQPTLVTSYIIKAVADVSNTFGVALAGAAGGDLIGSYPNPTITNITNAPVYNSNTTLSFRTSNVERMGIDASGRVTKPFQPICQLYNQTSRGAGSAITWTGTYVNIGSMWNGATRVTVPIAGTYLLTFEGMSDRVVSDVYIDLYKNGFWISTARQYAAVNTNAGHKQIAMHVYIAAGPSDYFEWVPFLSTMYSDPNGYMHASCALIA